MRILIATTQVPFIRGGAELLAEGLQDALRAAGHEAEIVNIPFRWYPPEKILDHLLACRLLDVTEFAGTPIDLLIGLKFPAYLIKHPNKVLWILHQHRTAYDLWDHATLGDLIHSPRGIEVRDAIRRADQQLIPEARAVFALSENVAKRLENFCGITSAPLYPPPPEAEKFYSAPAEDYLFFPSRLSQPKRQSLVLEALRLTREPVQVRFAGTADTLSYAAELQTLAARLRVDARCAWLGAITEEEKRRLYALALGVIFPPVDEDYGYVTLEAMLAAKPVITCADSGGPLEFVRAGETGFVAAPTPESLAKAMDELWRDRARAKLFGEQGLARYRALDIGWPKLIGKLLA
ncbi:MAG: glycosyltransferase family 4 protein [Pyrinomonadaceae bacterium]